MIPKTHLNAMSNFKAQSSNLEIKVKAEIEVKLRRINSNP